MLLPPPSEARAYLASIVGGALLWLIGGALQAPTKKVAWLGVLALVIGLGVHGIVVITVQRAATAAEAELERLESDPHTQWCRDTSRQGARTESAMSCLGTALGVMGYQSRISSFPRVVGTASLTAVLLIAQWFYLRSRAPKLRSEG